MGIEATGMRISTTARVVMVATVIALGALPATAIAERRHHRDVIDTRSGLTPDTNDPRLMGNFDYGVCRGMNPICYREWAEEGERQARVLVYSRTVGPRHANLGPALAAGLNPPLGPTNTVQSALKTWLEAEGIAVDWTEDVGILNSFASLMKYKAIIFASTSRDTTVDHGKAANNCPSIRPCPTAAQSTTTNAHIDAAKTALMQYLRAGGGYVGIHNAIGGTEYNWPYFIGLSGNAMYYDHGANQDGTVQIIANDSSTEGLPATWAFRDEWYNFVPFPTNVKFLAVVDENSLASRRERHPGHGRFHPIAWCQYYDGGRSFIMGLGHDRMAFIDGSGFPGQAHFKKFLVQGIKSAMGLTPFCTPNQKHRPFERHDDDDDDD